MDGGEGIRKAAIVPVARRWGAHRAAAASPRIVGKRFPTNFYADFVARYPTLVLVLAILPPLIIVFIAASEVGAIDLRSDSFSVRDHPVVRDAQTVKAALTRWSAVLRPGAPVEQQSAYTSATRTRPVYRIEFQFSLDLARMRRDGLQLDASASLFEETAMTLIREVEGDVRRALHYSSLCFRNDFQGGVATGALPAGCVPPVSLTTYFFPGSPINDRVWPMSGSGSAFQHPVDATTGRIQVNPNWRWFVGRGLAAGDRRVLLLRTQFVYGWPVHTTEGTLSERQYEGFLREHITDFRRRVALRLRAIAYTGGGGGASPPALAPYVDLVIGGDQVEEAAVWGALNAEYYRVPIAALLVMFFVFAHARSFVITFSAIVQLLLTFLVSTAIASFWQHRAPLLSSISLYVIISFVLDGTMVYYDTFIHSGIMPTTGRRSLLTVSQRIAFTMRKAATGVALANVVALGAFATSTASAIPAVSEFALLMVVVCCVNIYMALTFTPAYILFHHFYFSKRRRNLQRRHEITLERDARRGRHALQASFLQFLDKGRAPGELRFSELAAACSDSDSTGGAPDTQPDQNVAPSRTSTVCRDLSRRLRREFTMLCGRPAAPSRRQESSVAAQRAEADDPPPNGFDLGAFVDLGVAGSSEGAQPLAYMSPRMASPADVVHIPPALCFRSQHTVNHVAELLRLLVPTGSPTVAAAAAEGRGEEEDAENPPSATRSPREGEGRAEVPTRRSSSGCDSLAADSLEEVELDGPAPANPAPLHPPETEPPVAHPPALVAPLPPPGKCTSEESRRFSDKWGVVAEHLAIMPGAGAGAHLAPLIAHYVCCSHDAAYVISHARSEALPCAAAARPGRDGGQRAGRLATSKAAPAGFVAAPLVGLELDDEDYHRGRRGGGIGGRICRWWERRRRVQRRWCCGLLGRRVGETKEERDARIMGKAVKHEGFGKMERFFLNVWAPLVHLLRAPIAACTVFLLIVLSVTASNLSEGPLVVRVLHNDNSPILFSANRQLFGGVAECDFCSAYYRNTSEFYTASPDVQTVCRAQGMPDLMHAWVDECGICMGNNSCLDCRRIAHGPHVINECGECVNASALYVGDCGRCVTPEQCGVCQFRYGFDNSSFGPGCSVRCDATTCPPARGRCHPFTGQCECFADGQRGFFQGARCESCVAGFSPPVEDESAGEEKHNAGQRPCIVECSGAASTCGCQINGRCSTCDAFHFGNHCEHPWRDACGLNGVLRPTGCECKSWRIGGDRCQFDEQCSFHGRWHTTESAPAEGCGCRGNWAGPNCQFCGCFNGGACDEAGRCVCRGAWTGERCQECASTCRLRGFCPEPWPIEMYSQRECTALFCSLSEIDAGVPCAACRRESYIGPICAAHASEHSTAEMGIFACARDPECHVVKGTQCFSIYPSADPPPPAFTSCTCRGAWSGDKCRDCRPPVHGLTCLDDGRVQGCDGVAVEISPGADYAVRDVCGVCRGDGNCIGCDGIFGSSARLDLCGVCWGNNACLSGDDDGKTTAPRARGTVDIIIGDVQALRAATGRGPPMASSSFDVSRRATQVLMQRVCQEVFDKFQDVVTMVSCPVWAFVGWNSDRRTQFVWPSTNATVARLLFQFALETRRFDQLGFNTRDPNDPNLALLWMRILTRSNLPLGASVSALEQERGRLRPLQDHGELGPFVVVSNPEWPEALSKKLAITGLRYSLGVGAAVMVAVLAVLTCSATLAVCAAVATAVAVLFVLSVISWIGWGVGPVEQICASMLLGLVAQHIVHMVEAYLDTVHSAESHLFARGITSLAATKGALVRAGVSVVTSTVAVAVVSLLFIDSAIEVFRRTSQLIALMNLSAAFAALVLFAGLLAAVGPQETWRHWFFSFLWVCWLCGTAGTVLLIIYIAGGVDGPRGDPILAR